MFYNIFVLRSKPNISDSGFLTTYFKSLHFNNEVLRGIKGAQLPRVGYEFFASILIPLPSLDIQKQFVNKIEKEQAIVKSTKELIQMFEQKIKDEISKVWGK